jgi:predicted metalloendopeptidase
MIAPSFYRLLLRVAGGVALGALVAASLPAARAAAPSAAVALDPENFDTTCKACDDFWRYATGGWRARTKLPPGYPEWGAFDEVQDRNEIVLHHILDAAAAQGAAATDPDRARVGLFYAACNDVAAIDANGLQALQPELDRINAISSSGMLVAEIAHLDRWGVDDGLGFSSEADTRDSSKTIAGRDYYLAPRNAAIRTAYAHYIATQLTNLGEDAPTAAAHARAIIVLETTLAKATPPNADLRDPLAAYHPMPVAKLTTIAPHIPWHPFLASFGQADLRTADLNLPKFTAVLDRQIAATPLDTWRALLRVHLVTTVSMALPKPFGAAQFAFYSHTLQGIKQQRPRWKRCVAETDRELGDPLGKIYVAETFPPSAKARAKRLVDTLQSALHDDISTLPWMSPATRREAELKLAAYSKKIGYPDTWFDYSAVTFAPGDAYFTDLMKTSEFAQRRDLARIGKPTDRHLWGMTPPTVNAYYNPSNNEIVFPAGILQPPFFDAQADDAVIYGAIGAIIGHEMTHGFDDQGRQFDARGNLRDWWTPADAAHFKRRAQCIIDQFDGYNVEPGVHENGRLVTGEAIADLGGTTIAFRAFTRTAEYKAHVKIGGYTPEQRFFLSYAQAWRDLVTPEYVRQGVLVDPHPENRFRLIGTVGNMPEFQAAFACAMNAPMVRHDRCQIW